MGHFSPCRAWRGWRRSSSSPSTRSSRSGSGTSPTSTSRFRTGTRSTGTSATSCRRSRTSCPAGGRGACSCARCCTSALAVALSLAIGYPVAYYVSRYAHGRDEGRAARAAGRAVLDLVPDADVRVDEPARQRRLRGAGPERAVDRLAVRLGRADRGQRLARRAAGHGDHGPRLRLRAVPDPAAVRVAGPDRPAADRGRARPRRVAGERVPARRAAAVEGRDAGRDRADRAADVRRLLHARPDVGLAEDGACSATRSTTTSRAGRTRRSARR